MRLIDADVLLKKPLFESQRWHFININYIKNAPTVDAVPVRRGKWVKNDYSQTICSCCKAPIPGYWGHYENCPDGVWTEIEPTKCCPNCGAKMDLEVDND